MPAADLYSLMERAIRSQGISREVLMVEVIKTDLVGRATSIVGSHAIASLWEDPPSARSSPKAGRRQRARPAPTNTEYIPESAQIGGEGADAGANPLQLVLRQRLGERYMLLRNGMILVAVLWLITGPLLQASPFLSTYGFSLGFSLLIAVVVCSFPEDLSSLSGRKFVTTSIVIFACGATVGGVQNFFYRTTAIHVNAACKAIHGALVVAVSCNWHSFALAALFSKTGVSWSQYRRVLACDGASFLLATLALCVFGPPPVFPPGNMSLPGSILRGATTLGLGAITTQSNRRRLAALANRFGWNHVKLELRDLSTGESSPLQRDPCNTWSETTSTSHPLYDVDALRAAIVTDAPGAAAARPRGGYGHEHED